MINKIAREILEIDESENLNSALVNRKFDTFTTPLKKANTGYDTDHFHLYQRQGEELYLFRKELPCSIDGKDYVLSTIVDITLIEKERKYEAASNTAKSDFLAKMSHEIRTPMNGIIGMSETLSKEKLTANQKEYVEIITQSADLLLNIIDDILDYSKIEAGKMMIEDVPYLLREEVGISVDIFRKIAEDKGLKLDIAIDKNVPNRILGDPFRLRQVLSNLISNAVKFTHKGGIKVSVKLEEEYSGNINLLITVADTGVGIPKDKIDTIFDSFTQAELSTSRNYGGSGLGTTICKQLVTLMNGEIWVESPSELSKDDKFPGSAFNFTLEVYSNEVLDKNIDTSTITNLNNVHALVISKNPQSKKRLFSYLNHHKIQVDTLIFGEEINEDLKQHLIKNKEKYQLLIIVEEIGFSGIWLANELNKANLSDDYRIFLLSSNHKSDNYLKSRISGVDYYLISPFDQQKFNEYLKDCFSSAMVSEIKYLNLQTDIEILIAEDNIINQKVAESIFSNLGFEIDIAEDGQEAVRKVNEKAYDIIFMDLQMPEKDGIDATVDIRNQGFQMPIVAMTASPTEDTKSKSLSSGMNDYITKPVKSQTIQAILEKWFS